LVPVSSKRWFQSQNWNLPAEKLQHSDAINGTFAPVKKLERTF
jgi:hypothetical protein